VVVKARGFTGQPGTSVSFLGLSGTVVKTQLVNLVRPFMMYRSTRALQARGYLDFLARRGPDAMEADTADLWYLYRLVRRKKPKTIVEFGSGCSTVIFAQALFDNAKESEGQHGFLYSLDAEERWKNVTESSMSEELKDFCEIRQVPIETLSHKGQIVFRHQNVPQVPIDMIYLDGPPLTPEISVAIDPIDLEGWFQPGFVMCVDGRKENVQYLSRYLERAYQVQSNRFLRNTVFYLIE
jgi:hypothetical protein